MNLSEFTPRPAGALLAKSPTGIDGLDAILFGGLPTGRPTLIAGAAGCGKTLLGLTVLVNGAVRFDEPGVLMSFEERADDLITKVASLGYDLAALVADKKLVIDHVHLDRSDGPRVRKPTVRGFGSRLIERSLASELGGNATINFAPTGVVCVIEAATGDPPA